MAVVAVKKKRSWLRIIVECLLIVALVFVVRAWFQKDLPTGPAPEFQARLLDNQVVDLKDYRGKPLMLHFWASWCGFCTFAEDGISRINEDWQVLSVAYQSGTKDAVQKHVEEHGLDKWAVALDSDGRLAEMFNVTAVPATYIIDSSGNIRISEVGLTSSWGLRARLWLVEKTEHLDIKIPFISTIKSDLGIELSQAK